MRPRRVLLANPWSSCHGGTSMVLLDIVTHLDRARFTPLVLCPEPGELPRRLEELGLPVVLHSLTGLARETLLRFGRDVWWFRRFLRREQIDLVHFNGLKWRSSLAAAAKLCRTPYVTHVHNITRSVRGNFSCRWAQRLLPVSNVAGAPFYADPMYRDKTETVYNGVDLSRFAPSGPDNRAEIAAAGPVIGFVGHLVPGKGVLTLIEAMAVVLRSHPSAVLVIVGCPIPEKGDEYERECRRLVHDRNLAAQVMFTGFRRDVAEWMRTFDVFVLPTRSEMCPKVIIEAMATGRPVVTTRVGGIPEILSRPELGTLTSPDDPQATAQAVLRYLADREAARAAGEAAARHAREQFSIQAMLGRIQHIYDQVLTGSPQPA